MHAQSKYRLLVVRLGAMGDVLHALPAVTALRQAHPGWIIDWVVEPAWCALLTANCDRLDVARGPAQPVVDRLYLAATKAWRHDLFSRKTRNEISALHHELRASEYDAVLDLQGALRSAAVARTTPCRRIIGESHPREWAARWLFNERVTTRGAHIIEQDVELAEAVAGDNLSPVRPWLPVDCAAETWCDRILPPARTQPAVLLNPGAGWGAKRWPVERYAAVAGVLARRGYQVLVSGGPGEEPLVKAIQSQSGGAARPLNSSLAQLIALTRRVALMIAGDTGPLHLACALGRPVVGIYGPTDPARNGPYGAPSRVLRSPNSRRDHTRRTEPEAGLLTITPEAVLQAADDLLTGETVAMTRPANRVPNPMQTDWIARWQRIARRIRVPLGFLTAGLYLFELWRSAPRPAAIAWSLALVVPGLWLRAYASGYVKKNQELTTTGPYAYTRNPLYLGSMLMAAGFAAGAAQLAGGAGAGCRIRGDLCAGDRIGRTVSARHLSAIRRLLPPGAPAYSLA